MYITYIHIYMHIYMCIYIYIYVCVHVCMSPPFIYSKESLYSPSQEKGTPPFLKGKGGLHRCIYAYLFIFMSTYA